MIYITVKYILRTFYILCTLFFIVALTDIARGLLSNTEHSDSWAECYCKTYTNGPVYIIEHLPDGINLWCTKFPSIMFVPTGTDRKACGVLK